MISFFGSFLSSLAGRSDSAPSTMALAAAAMPSDTSEENAFQDKALQDVIKEMNLRATSLSYGSGTAFRLCFWKANEAVCVPVAAIEAHLSRNHELAEPLALSEEVPSDAFQVKTLEDVSSDILLSSNSISYRLCDAFIKCYGVGNELDSTIRAALDRCMSTVDRPLRPPCMWTELVEKYLSPKYPVWIRHNEVTQKDLSDYLQLLNSPVGFKTLSRDYEKRDKNAILAFYAWKMDETTLNQLASQVFTSAILNQIPAPPSAIKTYHYEAQFELLQEFLRFNEVGEEHFKRKLELLPASEQYFSVVELSSGSSKSESPLIRALATLPNLFAPVSPYKIDKIDPTPQKHMFILSTGMYKLYAEMRGESEGKAIEVLLRFVFEGLFRSDINAQ